MRNILFAMLLSASVIGTAIIAADEAPAKPVHITGPV